MRKKELINHLRKSGFSEITVKAFENIPRETFILPMYLSYAYDDRPLPLAEGSTISQPSTIAFMLDLLELDKGQVFLEIGSGCGYVLALVNYIVKKGKIFGLEINKGIADTSIKRLSSYSNITVVCGDGKKGLKEKAPFDRILISAACHEIPYYLLEQLNEKGIIVASVQNSIFKIIKRDSEAEVKEYFGFRFVPLI